MKELTIEGLKTIMRSCAGEDESVNLNSDIFDVSFEDLGYDSLALLEIAMRIKCNYDISIAEDDLDAIQTPGELLDLINSYLIPL